MIIMVHDLDRFFDNRNHITPLIPKKVIDESLEPGLERKPPRMVISEVLSTSKPGENIDCRSRYSRSTFIDEGCQA